jgi:hypothetical protein
MAKQVIYAVVRIELDVDSEEAALEIVENVNYEFNSDVEGAIVNTEIVSTGTGRRFAFI